MGALRHQTAMLQHEDSNIVLQKLRNTDTSFLTHLSPSETNVHSRPPHVFSPNASLSPQHVHATDLLREPTPGWTVARDQFEV